MEARLKEMAAKCSKNTKFLLLIVFAFLSDSNVIQGWGTLSKEEDLELDRQLHFINKPAIKSIQTQYGDIVDCIDIYKQLAFDHPLLKNHTIKMKPKTIPKGMKDEASTTNVFPAYVANISCPLGSVPIKRTVKEDLITDEYEKYARKNYLTKNSWKPFDPRGVYTAAMVFHGTIYGAKAAINIWKPPVYPEQSSRASIQIRRELSIIRAGWEVRKLNYSRLYVAWDLNGDFFGCINHICPGFVQVNPNIALGSNLHPSTYGGHQYELRISLFRDLATGDWWVSVRDQHIGYWPQELLPQLNRGGLQVSWGGQIYSRKLIPAPSMGSGHFPKEGVGKSAYFRWIKVLTDEIGAFHDPYKYGIEMDIPKPSCYNAIYNVSKDPQWGHNVFFGGPEACKWE